MFSVIVMLQGALSAELLTDGLTLSSDTLYPNPLHFHFHALQMAFGFLPNMSSGTVTTSPCLACLEHTVTFSLAYVFLGKF